MTLTFDADKHEYRLANRHLPSVTTILRDVGMMGDLCKYSDDYAMTRGSFVHKACEMYDLGTLDEDSLDPVLVGYVAAYKKFRVEMPLTWTEIEKPRYNAALGFAGCPDRVGDRVVLDIKTGAPQPWHPFQLAAYLILAGNASNYDKRYGLHLNNDGGYKLKPYESRRDFDIFRACLVVYNAKRGMI